MSSRSSTLIAAMALAGGLGGLPDIRASAKDLAPAPKSEYYGRQAKRAKAKAARKARRKSRSK